MSFKCLKKWSSSQPLVAIIALWQQRVASKDFEYWLRYVIFTVSYLKSYLFSTRLSFFLTIPWSKSNLSSFFFPLYLCHSMHFFSSLSYSFVFFVCIFSHFTISLISGIFVVHFPFLSFIMHLPYSSKAKGMCLKKIISAQKHLKYLRNAQNNLRFYHSSFGLPLIPFVHFHLLLELYDLWFRRFVCIQRKMIRVKFLKCLNKQQQPAQKLQQPGDQISITLNHENRLHELRFVFE